MKSSGIEDIRQIVASNPSVLLEGAEIIDGLMNVQVTYDADANFAGELLTNIDKFQYKIDDGMWQTATEIQTVSVPLGSTLRARYFDGTNGYKETSMELVNNELVFRADAQSFSPDVYNIPAGVKTVYAIIADCTDGISYQIAVSGSIINSQSVVISDSEATKVQEATPGGLLRASLKVIKMDLSGEAGIITTAVEHGFGNYLAWTAQIMYCK